MTSGSVVKTKAVINLTACRHNLSIAKQAAPESKCIAIIKANAYGHGMVEIARALDDADAFGIARIDEAVVLREAGISKPILLLEGFSTTEELELIRQHNIDCVLHNKNQVDLLENSAGDAINVFVKIDTGMHRLGFDVDDVSEVAKRLETLDDINKPIRYMTHFANADDKHDDKTQQQLELFYKTITDTDSDENSLANSAAILGWPQSHNAWNRPGIMLYGASPFINSAAKDHNLKPVMTLSSYLIDVKQVKKGEAIGYGGSYVCDKDKTVGVVAIGYGDGYPRHAKTGTPVLINGKRCDLLGRVSMDMICVDLDNQANAKVGDPVVLWGEGLPVEEIAESAGTISYELFCGVTSRVEFVYSD